MAQARGSVDTDGRHSVLAGATAAVGRGVGRVVERAGFWSTVIMPFVAVTLLVVQPSGWLPLVAGVFLANVVGAFAGHCYGREC